MHNSRFTVAIHILTMIARNSGQRAGACDPVFNSDVAAASVNTNPVVVRRVLGALRKASIVSSKSGRGGGWELSRNPRQITLADVYQALEGDEPIFAMHASSPCKTCPVGKNIGATLSSHYDRAEMALRKELQKTTIADIAKEIQHA
jgi:Rrf2 family protein